MVMRRALLVKANNTFTTRKEKPLRTHGESIHPFYAVKKSRSQEVEVPVTGYVFWWVKFMSYSSLIE
jgi:hypothetical protein